MEDDWIRQWMDEHQIEVELDEQAEKDLELRRLEASDPPWWMRLR